MEHEKSLRAIVYENFEKYFGGVWELYKLSQLFHSMAQNYYFLKKGQNPSEVDGVDHGFNGLRHNIHKGFGDGEHSVLYTIEMAQDVRRLFDLYYQIKKSVLAYIRATKIQTHQHYEDMQSSVQSWNKVVSKLQDNPMYLAFDFAMNAKEQEHFYRGAGDFKKDLCLPEFSVEKCLKLIEFIETVYLSVHHDFKEFPNRITTVFEIAKAEIEFFSIEGIKLLDKRLLEVSKHEYKITILEKHDLVAKVGIPVAVGCHYNDAENILMALFSFCDEDIELLKKVKLSEIVASNAINKSIVDAKTMLLHKKGLTEEEIKSKLIDSIQKSNRDNDE